MEASNLTIRIPLEIKEAFKKKAEEEGRNVTEVLMQFISDYLERLESPKQASLEKRVSRLEYVIEQKLEASLGELVA
ncbi:MAG: ribbon-helix-helix protein, CopG family [Rivularia sp. (in: cyanobacteria)]